MTVYSNTAYIVLHAELCTAAHIDDNNNKSERDETRLQSTSYKYRVRLLLIAYYKHEWGTYLIIQTASVVDV